ncbi:MAG: GTP cyclohydrolase I FolE2 [Thermodesulfobacteriota bacterium]
MKDIQSQLDHNRINIKKVGVKTISYPITVLDKAKSKQRTIAMVNMYVNLPHHFKGTHMSRFVEILNRFHGEIDLNSFHTILEEMKSRLEAEAAHIEMAFSYFLARPQRQQSLKGDHYDCRMHGSLEENDDLEFSVDVPVSLPFPGQGDQGLPRSPGHWGKARVSVRFNHFIWIEDLITLVEGAIDKERQECLQQISGPFSVESLTRTIGTTLSDQEAIKWFSVTVENLAEGYSTFAVSSG